MSDLKNDWVYGDTVMAGDMNNIANAVNLDTANITWYGSCDTTASTVAKIATTTAGQLGALTTGQKVRILFAYENTATSPTLNVDSKGAVSIKAYGTTEPTLWWNAGDVVDFTYNGTNWIMTATNGQIQTLNTTKANISLLTANNYIAQLAYSGGKYGFLINDVFYPIGGGGGMVPDFSSPCNLNTAAKRVVFITNLVNVDNGLTIKINNNYVAEGNCREYRWNGFTYGKFELQASDTVTLTYSAGSVKTAAFRAL